MPCLVALLALCMPRVAIVLVVIFSDYLGRAFDSVLWPCLGFVFLPLTTLATAWAINENEGTIDGLHLVVVVLAVLTDLGLLGTGANGRRSMPGRGQPR